MKSGWVKSTLLLWLVYLLLALLLTWPTITHLTTYLPGDGGDDPAIAWNLWWVKYALLNKGQNPFQTDFMFYPIGLNLAFYTLTVLNAVTALPLTLNLGVVTASNLHMLFSFISSGHGAFLLTRYILVITFNSSWHKGETPVTPHLLIWLSAAIAGSFYAFASSKLFYIALGQFNIGSSHWIPWAVLYILRAHRNPQRLKNAVMAGLFFTLQAWAELTYASFLLVFAGLYWLYWLTLGFSHRYLSPTNRPISQSPNPPILQSPISHLRAILILAFVFILGLSPILTQMLPDMIIEGDFLVEGSGFAGAYSADLFGFVIPTMHHSFGGQLVRQTGIMDFDKGQHIYLGLILIGLSMFNLRAIYRRPGLRFWLVAALVFGLLCLGPNITINGERTGWWGPFNILQQLPFFKGNRYPSRYSVILLLSLSVLAGFGLTHLAVRLSSSNWKQIMLFMGVPTLFLFEHLSIPLPQSDMRTPPAYQVITAEPGEFTLLDIPLAWRNGFSLIGAQTTQFMFGQFYQTAHQKRLIQGNTSRNPEFKFQYFVNAPVISSLLAVETGRTLPPERWQTDKIIAAEVLHFFDIKYIIVRPYRYTRYDGQTVTEQPVIPYIEQVLPVEKIHDEAAIKIYRVKENATGDHAPSLTTQITTDSPLAPLYFGEGWGLLSPGQPIAAQRHAVRLLLPLTGEVHQVAMRIKLPDFEQNPARSVWIALNGWQSSAQMIQSEWQELTFQFPAEAIRPGLNNIWLHFDGLTGLPELQPETPPLDVTAISAGKDAGDFGHIFINGHEVSPNERGYNIVTIHPDTYFVQNFDTHFSPDASADLAHALIPNGRDRLENVTIAIAAADEASLNLTGAAVQAIHQATGATGDLRGCFRCSHALIAQVGPTETRVLEALDPLRPVGLTTKLGLTEPHLAAIIDWIRIKVVK